MTGEGTGDAAKDPPIPEQIADQVATLHAEKMGRNEIARALGVSGKTVTRAAAIAGVQFDTTATAAATRSRVDRLEDDRADIAAMSAQIAKRAGRRLFIEIGEPVLHPETARTLATVYGITADKLDKLSASITDHRDQYAAANAWLEGLRLQFDAVSAGQIEPDADGHFNINFPTPTPLEES